MSSDTRFKPGNPGGGRPKGSRNKLSEQFLADMLATWERYGAAALERVATEEPVAFIRIAAKLLPREIEPAHDLLAELQALSVEEMEARLEALHAERDRWWNRTVNS